MTRDEFKSTFSKTQALIEKKKTKFIEKYILKDDSLKFLSAKLGVMFKEKSYRIDSILTTQDEPISTVYLVYSGTIELLRTLKIRDTSRHYRMKKEIGRSTLSRLISVGVGMLIGIESLFDEQPCKYSAKVSEDAKVYEISMRKLRHVCNENRHISEALQIEATTYSSMICQRLDSLQTFENCHLEGFNHFLRRDRKVNEESTTYQKSNSSSNIVISDFFVGGKLPKVQAKPSLRNSIISNYMRKKSKYPNEFGEYLIRNQFQDFRKRRPTSKKRSTTLIDSQELISRVYNPYEKIVKKALNSLNLSKSREKHELSPCSITRYSFIGDKKKVINIGLEPPNISESTRPVLTPRRFVPGKIIKSRSQQSLKEAIRTRIEYNLRNNESIDLKENFNVGKWQSVLK